MSEKESREKLFSLSKKHLSKVLISLFTAFLIWLFGILVFIPFAQQILPQRIPLAISLTIFVAFSFFIKKSYDNGLLKLLDSTSDVLAYEYKNWKKSETSIQKLKPIIHNIVYVLTVILLYLLYSPLLTIIHPALNGLVMIPIILWIMWTIIKTLNNQIL
jgi:hypothetical protein